MAAPDALAGYASEVWGAGCYMDQMGVWDPPLALKPAASLAPPSMGPGPTTVNFVPTPTPATPASTLVAHPTPTPLPQISNVAPLSQAESLAADTDSTYIPTSDDSSKGEEPSNGGHATEICDVACKIASLIGATPSGLVEGHGGTSSSVPGLILGVSTGALGQGSHGLESDLREGTGTGTSRVTSFASDTTYASQPRTTASGNAFELLLNAEAVDLLTSDVAGRVQWLSSLDHPASLTTIVRGHTPVMTTTAASLFTIGTRTYSLLPARGHDNYVVRSAGGIFSLRAGIATTMGYGEIWSAATDGLVYQSGDLTTTVAVSVDASELFTTVALSEPTSGRVPGAPTLPGSRVESLELQQTTASTLSGSAPSAIRSQIPGDGYVPFAASAMPLGMHRDARAIFAVAFAALCGAL